MSKLSLTPGKQVSTGAIAGLVFFLIFGIGFAILVGEVLAENDASPIMFIVFYIFIIGWIGTVLFMLIYNIKNLKSSKGLSLIDINTESEPNNKDTINSPMQRLRELESLKKEGLITEKEYEQKRTQIMEEKW
jgi:hypothetical protein